MTAIRIGSATLVVLLSLSCASDGNKAPATGTGGGAEGGATAVTASGGAGGSGGIGDSGGVGSGGMSSCGGTMGSGGTVASSGGTGAVDAAGQFDFGASYSCGWCNEQCVVGETYCYQGGCKPLPATCKSHPSCDCVPEGGYVNCSCSGVVGRVVINCQKI